MYESINGKKKREHMWHQAKFCCHRVQFFGKAAARVNKAEVLWLLKKRNSLIVTVCCLWRDYRIYSEAVAHTMSTKIKKKIYGNRWVKTFGIFYW